MAEYSHRSDAMQAGALTYQTGKPCVRGHKSQRYTRNGACIECLKSANAAFSEARALTPNERRDAMAQLVEMGMRLFHTDVPVFADLATAMVQARYPNLTRADVVGRCKPTGVAAGTGFYPFKVHADDVTMLRDVAKAYCSAHTKDQTGVIASRLAAAAEAAAKERDNGAGEWKFT